MSDIDIIEEDIKKRSVLLLDILLQDKTTKSNIRWCCNQYEEHGELYKEDKEILPELITGKNTKLIQPRIAKSKLAQKKRTQQSAEVFTPSWICNEMNNICDEEWFGMKNIFNISDGKKWISTKEPITFIGNNWKKYIDSRRLEITCGEAPYLASRYDTTTGDFLEIHNRIGILDRKLRVVSENTSTEFEWFHWTKRAYESIYGYEYQGDNLLLARENLVWTFIDYYKDKFNTDPSLQYIKQIANIIAWNIWQMDGLTDSVPLLTTTQEYFQQDLFETETPTPTPIFCKIKNW